MTLDATPTMANDAARLQALQTVIGAQRLSGSPLAPCLAPLLMAVGWTGTAQRLHEHLPDEPQPFDAAALSQTLSGLGFGVRPETWSRWRQHGPLEALPAGSVLLTGQPGGPIRGLVFLGSQGGQCWWHDGTDIVAFSAPEASDSLLVVRRDVRHLPVDAPQAGWLRGLLFDARHEIGGLLFISLVANLLALVISLFTMFVYNTIIPSGAMGTLWALTGGAVLAIVGAWGLRLARVKMLSDLTGWAGEKISSIAMRKTLGLPTEVSARLGVENNLIRLRSMEGVRQWFGGAGGAVNVDYPFVVIFLVVIAVLGGWIVLVPLLGLGLFALVSWPLAQAIKVRSAEVSRVSRTMGELTSTVARRLRALRGVRGSALWNRQLPDLVAQSVLANRNYALINGLSQTVGQALGMLIVLATMAAGIALVLSGAMSTGGLIATMMLIWRVTTPAQQMFASQVRLEQLGDASRQLDRLLASAGETAAPHVTSPVTGLSASVTADRLYYRYSADREPALTGISFQVEPGQVLAVVGPNGAGKTTLLEMLAGARAPQSGRVLAGGRDIHQFDAADYRAWLGYMPQQIAGLPGSLRESMQLRCPGSSDEELIQALELAAGKRWWTLLGAESATAALDLSILPWREDREAVRGRSIVRLAAATLGRPPLILLDDPVSDSDPALDPHFLRLLESLRGTCTIILTTHRPELIQRADLIAVLNDGALAHFGPVTALASA